MKYLIVDCECTGLFSYDKPADAPGQPRVCQIGMIFTDEALEIESEVEFLIRPNGWWVDPESEAAKVHGLTHQRLMAEGVPMGEVITAYGAAIDERRLVGGFNVTFDAKLLRAELRHAGLPDRFMATKTICAMQGCRKLVGAVGKTGKPKAPTLAEACTHFGIEQQAGHTALDDARSALAIFRKLRELGQMPAYKDPYDTKSSPVPKVEELKRKSREIAAAPLLEGPK